MPNHCSNHVYLPAGENAHKVLEPYLYSCEDDGSTCLDFNKVVPMPPELLAETTQYSTDKAENERIRKSNLAKFGFRDWYDWRLANWDTKWNAYWGYVTDDHLQFSTAWSSPTKVVAQLAKLLNKPLRLTYVDEAHLFFGETFFDKDGDVIEDNCYGDVSECPRELAEELGVVDEEMDENVEDDKALRSEAEAILMKDETYKNLMKGMKK